MENNSQTDRNENYTQENEPEAPSASVDDFYKNGKVITYQDYENINEDFLFLPCGTESQIREYVKNIKENDIAKKVSIDDKITMRTNFNTLDFTNKKDLGKRAFSENLKSTVAMDGKELGMRNIVPKSKNTSLASLKLKISDKLGIGRPTVVPLWHSGFYVTLEPFNNNDIINLELELSDRINDLGKSTHNLIYSNHSVLFAEVLVNFLRDKIIDTSLKLPEGKDIFDYMLLQDLNILVWGALKTMYPRGYDFIMQCKNTLHFDENKIPKCNFKVHLKLDFKNLLRIDDSKLTEQHKKHMLKIGRRSMEIEDVEEYQNTLEANGSDSININIDDLNININIKSPNINRYLVYGEYFIDNLQESVNSLVGKNIVRSGDDSLLKDEKEAKKILINGIVLQIYNHYIESIVINGKVTDEIDDVTEILNDLSSDNDNKNMIINKIMEYIDNSLVAIVGIPDYTCPTCKETQADNGVPGFRSFIGLDVYMYFFTLLASKYQNSTKGLITD